MKIRKFEPCDFLEVVGMFKDFIKELYPNRKLGTDIAFIENVLNWIKLQRHIFVTTTNEGKITGFTMSYVNYNDYVTEPVYHGEIAYVKPMYRGGKSAYLLYNNVVHIADDIGLILTANAFENQFKIEQIQRKFNGKKIYISMERERG